MVRLDLVVGARPNLVKAAPVLEQLRMPKRGWDVRLIHTGQHYDERMSGLFFRQLGMPEPDVNLEVGSGSHAVQTAGVMIALEEQFASRRPDLVMVFGDVNSTLAAAVVTSKMQIPLAHVEAGLRSFDRTMPEEINRVLTDAVSDLLFTTEPKAVSNLLREGIPAGKIHFVGNTMIDTLLAHRDRALALDMPGRFGLNPYRYVLATLHRPSNVDKPARLERIISTLIDLASSVPVIFPAHPRTAKRLREMGLWECAEAQPDLLLLPPLGYLEFLGLTAKAGVILTDSGGVQEEATALGIPCLTLRRNTERPVTVSAGTNMLVGDDPKKALTEARRILQSGTSLEYRVPEKWDGKAAVRIVNVLERWMDG